MDSQRAAGQGEAKAQQKPQPQAPPYGRLGAPYGRPVGLECAFVSPWPAARCESMRLVSELVSRSELNLKTSPVRVQLS